MARNTKSKKLDFKGKDLEYYEALMKAREAVVEQMRHHADDVPAPQSEIPASCG